MYIYIYIYVHICNCIHYAYVEREKKKITGVPLMSPEEFGTSKPYKSDKKSATTVAGPCCGNLVENSV